jgi:ATP-binding cassette subfamily B protein
MRPYRRSFWMALLLLPLIVLLQLAQPYLLMVAIEGDAPTMLKTAYVLIGLVVLTYLLESTHAYMLQCIGHRCLTDLRAKVFGHLLAQGTRFFDRRPVGALLSRVTSDTEAVGQSFMLGMVSLTSDILLVIGTICVMLWLAPGTTLYLLLLAPIIFLIIRLFNRVLRLIALRIRRQVARVNSTVEENLAGIDMVQLFRREQQSAKEHEELTAKYFGMYARFNIADASLFAIMESLAAITVGAILWFSIDPVLEGAMSLGLVVAFIEYTQRAFRPIKEMSGKLAGLQSAFAALDRLDSTLSYDEKLPSGTSPWLERKGFINFRDINFRYEPDGPLVLRDFELTIPAGERLAIVGPTGSGKTTILNLLTRHYDPGSARILVDDLPIESIDETDFRQGVAVIRQDVFLFDGTVADNIALGDNSISREDIESAARDVQLLSLLTQRSRGLDTPVGEGGRNLSAGEAQLLTIARAIVRDPTIVLLDEPTSRVDSLTESLISSAIQKLMENRTVVVVAHRLATVRSADRIIVLRSGQISESGTHDTLIGTDGLYARMWRHRLRTESTRTDR